MLAEPLRLVGDRGEAILPLAGGDRLEVALRPLDVVGGDPVLGPAEEPGRVSGLGGDRLGDRALGALEIALAGEALGDPGVG